MSTRIPACSSVLVGVILCVTLGIVVDAQKLYTSTDAVAATGFATVYPGATEAVLERGAGAFVASEVGGTILGSTDPNTVPFAPLFSANFYESSDDCQHQRTPTLLNARQGLDVAANAHIGTLNASMVNSSVLYLFFICQPAGTSTATGGKLFVTISNDYGSSWVDPVAVGGLSAAGTLLLASTSVLVSGSKWVLPVFLISKSGYAPTSGCLTRLVLDSPVSSLSAGGSLQLTVAIVPVATTDGSKDACGDVTSEEPIAAAVSVASSVSGDGTVLFITQAGNATGSFTPLRVISCTSTSSTLCTVVATSVNTTAFVTSGNVQLPGLMVSSNFATTVQNASTSSADIASIVGVHESVQETIRLYIGANVSVTSVLSDAAARIASRSVMEILPSNMVSSDYYITLSGLSIAFLPTLPASSTAALLDSTSAEVGMGKGQRVANLKQDSPPIMALVTFSSQYINHIDQTNAGRINASLDTLPIVLVYPPPGPAPLSNGNPVLAASVTFSILGLVTIVLIAFFFVGKCADDGVEPEEEDDEKQPFNEPEDSERAPLVRTSAARCKPLSVGVVNKDIHAGDIHTPHARTGDAAAPGRTRESESVHQNFHDKVIQSQTTSVNSEPLY